jgi:hypothetical protein
LCFGEGGGGGIDEWCKGSKTGGLDSGICYAYYSNLLVASPEASLSSFSGMLSGCLV